MRRARIEEVEFGLAWIIEKLGADCGLLAILKYSMERFRLQKRVRHVLNEFALFLSENRLACVRLLESGPLRFADIGSAIDFGRNSKTLLIISIQKIAIQCRSDKESLSWRLFPASLHPIFELAGDLSQA